MRAIALSILLLSMPLYTQSQDMSDSVITTPGLSSKCKVLLDMRTSKVQYRQRLSALIDRNIKLQHQEIESQKVKANLIKNLRKLRNELILTKSRIRHITEDVVRKGCPGVTL